MKSPKKLTSIFILIRSLNVGGAERQVSVLAQALHKLGYKVTVGVFYAGGALERELKDIGVSILPLGKKSRWDLIGWFWGYVRTLRKTNPDVVYSFLTTANIVALIGRLFVRKPVVWGIRASNMNLEAYDWLVRLTSWMEKELSRFVKTIIFNARSSRKYHESLGYYLHRGVVISNGIDTQVFKPDAASRACVREKLGIPQGAFVVGMLARVDPMKDYETYRAAAHSLLPHDENLFFITAGKGTDVASWSPVSPRFLKLGIWDDVPGLMNALDIMVLCSSFGEGFPNVIGEAMSCGVPTITTDVGDAAYVVGHQGLIIPLKNKKALVQAIKTLMDNKLPKDDIRNRIISKFSVSKMVNQTIKTLTEACSLL